MLAGPHATAHPSRILGSMFGDSEFELKLLNTVYTLSYTKCVEIMSRTSVWFMFTVFKDN